MTAGTRVREKKRDRSKIGHDIRLGQLDQLHMMSVQNVFVQKTVETVFLLLTMSQVLWKDGQYGDSRLCYLLNKPSYGNWIACDWKIKSCGLSNTM